MASYAGHFRHTATLASVYHANNQQPFHVQNHLKPLFSPFWCSVWTSANRLHHIQMPKYVELLPCDWLISNWCNQAIEQMYHMAGECIYSIDGECIYSIYISLWSLPYTQMHCHVWIEKGPVQTVAIKLEAHNYLEYHYMLKNLDLYSWKLLK